MLHVLAPTGPTGATQWTPFGAPTNWQAVAAGDSAYVLTVDDGTYDLYTFESLPGSLDDSHECASVKVYFSAIGDGIAELHSIVNSAGTDGSGFPFAVPPETPGQTFFDEYTTDPATGLPWLVSAVNALLAGIEAVTAAAPTAVNRVWLVVDDGDSDPESAPLERAPIGAPVGRARVTAPVSRAELVVPIDVHRVDIGGPGGRRAISVPDQRRAPLRVLTR